MQFAQRNLNSGQHLFSLLRVNVRNPLFYLGFAIRVVLIAIVPIPESVTTWYGPFVDSFIKQPSLDPWSTWAVSGGNPQAFPYGFAMLLAFVPFGTIANLIQTELAFSLAYTLTLVFIDLVLFFAIQRLHPNEIAKITNYYWLSPVVIFATYVLGANDIIPVLFLVFALAFLRKSLMLLAGISLVVAISAKASMILVVPIFAILFLRNKNLRQKWKEFAGGMALGTFGFIAPFVIVASGGVAAIIGNTEAGKVWGPQFSLGQNLTVYLVPLAYSLVLYLVWRVRRLNFDLFEAAVGLVFIVIVLTTPSSPGWFVWIVPLLLSLKHSDNRRGDYLVWIFGVAFVFAFLPTWLKAPLQEVFAGLLFSPEALARTLLVAVGALLAFRVWRDGVTSNDYFVLSQKPFAIGIAGDSGTGKDTLANALTELFGRHSTSHLSGDNYHLWDRNRPMWQFLTHLNPLANNLIQFERDATNLIKGRSVQTRHYDHARGKNAGIESVRANDFVIVSGLHTLNLPLLVSVLDVSIFLDMDEDLRRHFKIQRDVLERGHDIDSVLTSIGKRVHDANVFVSPQKEHADLVFSAQPTSPLVLGGANKPRLKLRVETRLGLDDREISRVLIGVCGLHVERFEGDRPGSVVWVLEGEAGSQDFKFASTLLAPRVLEFIDSAAIWHDGTLGLMQLMFVAQLEQVLAKRAVN